MGRLMLGPVGVDEVAMEQTATEQTVEVEPARMRKNDPISYHHFRTAGTIGVLPRSDEKCIIAVALVADRDQFTRELGRRIVAGRIWKRNQHSHRVQKLSEWVTLREAEVGIKALRQLEKTLIKIGLARPEDVAEDLRSAIRDLVKAPQRKQR